MCGTGSDESRRCRIRKVWGATCPKSVRPRLVVVAARGPCLRLVQRCDQMTERENSDSGVPSTVGPSADRAVLNRVEQEHTSFATQGGSQPSKPAAGMERDTRPSLATDETQRAGTPSPRAGHGGFSQWMQHSPASSASANQPMMPAIPQPEASSRKAQALSPAQLRGQRVRERRSGGGGAELQLDANSTSGPAALDRLSSWSRVLPLIDAA